jgi:site-specific DNA-methyltransferase (adenine-specific)/adenine-specific DNA-methyltransferase
MTKISKKDRDNLIKLLQEGNDIPEKYQDVLFANEQGQKEYELTYAGKAREEDIIADTLAAPLQEVRTFNSDNKFDDDWTNKLIFGDNLMALKNLYEDPKIKGKIRLIYIDPPFATKKEFRGSQDQKAYQDKVAGSKFLEFVRRRLTFLKPLLHAEGSIYVHLDYRTVHYVKTLMDEIFEKDFLVNEIIYGFRIQGISRSSWARKHQTILMYSKGKSFYFKPEKEIVWYDKPFIDTKFKKPEIEKLKDKDISIIKKCLEDKTPLPDRYKALLFNKHYSEVYVRDVWDGDYTKPLISGSSEYVNYPTQKSEGLLSRVISASSVEGDIVLDAFAGSGTTLAVAEKLKRRWIGIDCGKLAIYTVQKRILNLCEEIGNKGNPLKAKAFTLYNAGLYDWAEVKKLDFGHYRDFVLKLFQVREEKHIVRGIEVDGYIGNENAYLWNHTKEKKAKLDLDFIKSLHNALSGKGGEVFYIIAPTNAFAFYEDEIKHDDTIYKTLRVPQSVITELIKRGGDTIKQPTSEQDVNDTIDAVGFDFIQVPQVETEYKIDKPKAVTLLNQKAKECVVKIKTFKSRTLTKSPEEFQNFETLSMVMVDYNYDGKIFDLDEVFYADTIKPDFEVRFDSGKLDKQMMLIYLDIYGNEKKEILSLKDFGK